MASVRSELQAGLNKGKWARNIEEPWWMPEYRTGRGLSALADSIGTSYDKAKLYAGNELDDTYASLTNLLKVADSEEGMNLYNKQLEKFSSDSLRFGGFEDNIVQADTLKLLGKQKNDMRRNFDTAVQDSSDFINTDQFLDEADEFVNIQDTIDRLNKEHLEKIDPKTGKKYTGKLHKSVSNFLQSEILYANGLHDNMVGGFQIGKEGELIGTNFRYNKAEDNDKDAFRKLQKYRDRLTLATYSLAGDGKISSEEAKAIVIGDEKQYNAAKNTALRKAEDNYKTNRSIVGKYDGLINTALQKKLSTGDIFNIQEMDDASKLELGTNLTAGNWDSVVTQLKNEKAEYKRLRNEANENYKNWYGSYFEKIEGGLTLDDMGEFDFEEIKSKEDVKKAIKEKMGHGVPEIDVTEEQKAETKKKKRQVLGVLPRKEPEDKELYTSSEKILEDYIKGNVSADSLREIGGQSLVSSADRIKSASKGSKPKATIIPGVKTKEREPIDIDTLKTLNFTSKAGKYSWHDVVNQIYSKKGKGLSVADDYLSGDIKIGDLKITYRKRRDRAEKIKQQFQKLNISLDEFKKNYKKDYTTLINLLGKSRT
jgi:hypothetical protein